MQRLLAFAAGPLLCAATVASPGLGDAAARLLTSSSATIRIGDGFDTIIVGDDFYTPSTFATTVEVSSAPVPVSYEGLPPPLPWFGVDELAALGLFVRAGGFQPAAPRLSRYLRRLPCQSQ